MHSLLLTKYFSLYIPYLLYQKKLNTKKEKKYGKHDYQSRRDMGC